MPRQKQNRYELINNDPRVIQWLHAKHVLFPNNETGEGVNHVVVEVACGRGEYSVWLAHATQQWLTQYASDTLFVGVDQKGDRVGVGLRRVHELWLQTVRFVCGIVHHISQWFSPASVDELRIIHPDPRPRDRDIKRRLTHPRFLELYHGLLKSDWLLKLKTDDRDLFDYSGVQLDTSVRECVKITYDLHADAALLQEHYGIQTHYEKLALEEWRTICYGVWRKR